MPPDDPNTPLVQKLQQLERQMVDAVAKNKPLEEIAEIERYRSLVEKAINFSPKEKSGRQPLFIIALLATILPLVMASIQLDHLINAEIVVSEVSFVAPEGAAISGIMLDAPLRLSEFSGIDLELKDHSSTSKELRLVSGKVFVDELFVPSNSRVRLGSLDSFRLDVSSRSGPIVGNISVTGDYSLRFSDGSTESGAFENPEAVAFWTDQSQLGTISRVQLVSLHPPEAVILSNERVDELVFDRQEITNAIARDRKSSVIAGSIDVPDVARNFTLKKHDELKFEIVELMSIVLLIEEGALKVDLSAKVKNTSINRGFSEIQLAPNLLEYIYKNHELGLWWAAAGLFWSLLYSGRKLWSDK